MKFEIIIFKDLELIRNHIAACQCQGHVQQVAYSTYHDCLTQICFTCRKIKTNIKEDEIKR